MADIRTLRQEAEQALQEELERLKNLEKTTDQQARTTIAELKAAMASVRDEGVIELERLQALESEILCKQAEQLAKLKHY